MGAIAIDKTATINAPADRVWEILADEFTQVGEWASSVDRSHDNPEAGSAPEGADAAGRVCDVPGFGLTDERFTQFDRESRTFAYSVAADKIPAFVTSLENGWTIEAVGENATKVTSKARADTSGLAGALMSPMMKRKFDGTLDQVLDDLKVYAETGRPSAAKKKAQAKLAKRR